MARRVNSGLATLLVGASQDDEQWAATFKSAFGETRRIVCKRTSASDVMQSTVYNTGTTFRDIPLVGEMLIENGVITNFGKCEGAVTSAAANLLTGTSVLRLEGNGNWVEGSLGLSVEAQVALGVAAQDVKYYDFTFDVQPTATNGLGLTSGFSLLRGGSAPVDGDTMAPYSVTLQDWVTGSAGSEQTIFFDEQGEDIVWDDAEITADIGVTPYRRSKQTLVHGVEGDALELGVHRFILPAHCNEEALTPVYQVLIAMKPFGRWSEYPAMSTYNSGTDSTFLKPCKIFIKNRAGVVLHTIEMHDGLPINDPSLGQTRDLVTAFRPLVHTKQMLHWTSAKLKLAQKARKYHNGVMKSNSMRPKQARSMISAAAVTPWFATVRQQNNGHLHMMASPPWPLSTSAGLAEDPVTDPHLPSNIDTINYAGNHNNGGGRRPTRSVGYMYEPGSVSGHDWYISPGGQRFDRYFVPSHLTVYVSDPTGNRPQGPVSWRVICDEYGKAHFNHGHHDVTNPRQLGTIPFEQVGYGQWAYAYGYYTPQGPTLVGGGTSRHIDTKTIINGEGWPTPDKDGRHHYHGWNVDNQHSYVCPGWYMLMFNSVIHAFSQKLKFYAMLMSSGSGWGRPTCPVENYMMLRQHAWRVLNFAQMWKMTANHSLSIPRADLEERWKQELEYFYDQGVVPATDPTHAQYNSIFNQGLRKFGHPAEIEINGTSKQAVMSNDEKTMYMMGALIVMKQTGSWAAMSAKSAKCAESLMFILKNIHNYSVTRMLATEGRLHYAGSELGPVTTDGSTPVMYNGWKEWVDIRYPKTGVEDLVTNPDGSNYSGSNGPERFANYQHLWLQTIFAFRDFFGEYNLPGVEEACTMCQVFEDKMQARVTAGGNDFPYRHPAVGILMPPEV